MAIDDEITPIPQAEAIAGLGLVIMSLAYYFSPGDERARLVAWMESQEREFGTHGLPPAVLQYFSNFVSGLRSGQSAEMLKRAHRPDEGLH